MIACRCLGRQQTTCHSSAPSLSPVPRALCEDFLQNNGTPSAVAPITAAATWDEDRLAALGPLPASGGSSPDARRTSAVAGSTGGASSVAGLEAGGSQAGDGGAEDEADAACWLGGSPPKASSGSQGLGSSPSKRGGIPLPRNSSGPIVGSSAPALPPVRAQAALLPLASWQQVPAGQPPALQPPALGGQAGQPQPGTPLTPASSSNTPSALGSSFQRSGAGFLRSVSVDSDNPSLGFGAREALQQLRWALRQAGARGLSEYKPRERVGFSRRALPDAEVQRLGGAMLDALRALTCNPSSLALPLLSCHLLTPHLSCHHALHLVQSCTSGGARWHDARPRPAGAGRPVSGGQPRRAGGLGC